VDDRRHEPQNTAGTLELEQGRPVGVEPIEHFGVNGIGRLDALFIVRLVVAFGREFLLVVLVEF